MNDQVLFALLGAIFGGSGLAIINKLLSRGKDKFDLAAKIREELREDIKRYQDEVKACKTEVSDLRKEVDTWRTKYFDLDREHNDTINAMQEEIDKLKRVLHSHGINYKDEAI